MLQYLIASLWLITTNVNAKSFILHTNTNNHDYGKAGKQLYRYIYMLTNEDCYIDIYNDKDTLSDFEQNYNERSGIILGSIDQPLIQNILAQNEIDSGNLRNSKSTDSHSVHFIPNKDENIMHILCIGSMNSEASVHYCIYSLLQLIGLRFHIHSDTIPSKLTDKKQSMYSLLFTTYNKYNNAKNWLFSPSFNLRGIQPFHDFAEGPDWWYETEYKLYSEQIYKMKMNFMGFHTYPVREPLVWTGLTKDFDQQTGYVTKSYPTSWMTTLGWVAKTGGTIGEGGDWGGIAINTSNYLLGANLLYPKDCYSNEIQQLSNTINESGIQICPYGSNTMSENVVFNNAGNFLNTIFTYVRDFLYIKTCVGTETSLTKPPNGRGTTAEYYEGIFSRIEATYPIDYYWLWTPENWEWFKVNNSNPVVNETITDIITAYKVMKSMNVSFNLATCGWVLGPEGNRSYLDYVLPKDITLSSIEMDVGWDDPEPSYGNITDRDTWSIPWMEDDPGLTALQLWVNRTMTHIEQTFNMDVQGLFGIHWRTQEISAQLSALQLMSWNVTNEFGKSFLKFQNNYNDYSMSLNYWIDFVCSEFGLCDEIDINNTNGTELAILLDSIDSFNLPRQNPPRGSDVRLNMSGCPGVIHQNYVPWKDIEGNWSFVDQIIEYKQSVTGLDNQYRFEYWGNMFEYFRMMAKVGCDWYKFDKEFYNQKLNKNNTNYKQLLILKNTLSNDVESMVNYFMAAMESKGSMGTLTDIQQQLIPLIFDSSSEYGDFLVGSLPDEYTGVTRMFVMSPRSMLFADDGENYPVNIVILSKRTPNTRDIVVYYRSLTTQRMIMDDDWKMLNVSMVADGRQLYKVEIDISEEIIYSYGFQYYVEAKADGDNFQWPAGEPFVVSVL